MQKSFCFAPSNRFFYYKYEQERLPKNLGPGSYNPHESFIALSKSPCPVKVKPMYKHTKESGEGKTYYADGGLLMKDPHAEKIYGR